MTVTEEELAEKRTHLAKLRQQTVEARARRLANEAQVGRDLSVAELDAEIAQQEAELAREKEAAKITNVRAGSATNLEAAKAIMAAAAGTAVAAEPDVGGEEEKPDEPVASPSGPADVKVTGGGK
jgi:hypothetical protein